MYMVFGTMFLGGFLLHLETIPLTFTFFLTDRLRPAVIALRHLAYSALAFGAAGAFLSAEAYGVPWLIRLIAAVGLVLLGLRATRDLRRDFGRLRP